MFALVLRILARPIIGIIKSTHMNNRNNFFAPWFVSLGKIMSKLQNYIYNKYITRCDTYYRPIQGDPALIKGIEYFYDGFFYYFAFAVPLMMIFHRVQQQRDQNRRVKQNIMTADEIITQLEDKLKFLEQQIIRKGLDFQIEEQKQLIKIE